MSEESSPANQSKPVLASETDETVTPVSPTVGVSDLTASFQAMDLEMEKKLTIVHRSQVGSPSGANRSPRSLDTRDQKRTSPSLVRRYALQMWLEIEIGPRQFVPPEDDSCSADFAVEVVNKAYPGCTGVYLGRMGHMLAFYGRKGSPKAGLIQEVAIEACRAVGEIPTWIGYTAQWRVRCISLAEANEILTGCKRLEQESRRREHLHFQECLASMHPPTNLSATAAPFWPRLASPTSRLKGAARGIQGRESDGSITNFSPPCRPIGSPLSRMASPTSHQGLQTSDNGGLSTDGSTIEAAPHKKKQRGRGSRSSQSSRSGRSTGSSKSLLPPMEKERKRISFLAKSISLNLEVRRATLVM